MPDPDVFPQCGDCTHWTDVLPPDADHGFCGMGVSQPQLGKQGTKEDFGCILHSSLQDDD